MENELIQSIAATTGPLGTLLVFVYMSLRGKLGEVMAELQKAEEERARLERRIYVLELSRQGVPQYQALAPTPVKGVPT